jgi:hypothetical protein
MSRMTPLFSIGFSVYVELGGVSPEESDAW